MKHITKLSIFDFDGTLINTPLPDSGREIYEKVTGEPWPHKGWWAQPLSLDMDIFDIRPNESVVSDYKKEIADDNTLTVLLTGRLQRLSKEVENILSAYGLSFDGYFYNTGGSTDSFKIKTMLGLKDQFPSIENIQMWEDRLEHINLFNSWGQEQINDGNLKRFEVTYVLSDNHK